MHHSAPYTVIFRFSKKGILCVVRVDTTYNSAINHTRFDRKLFVSLVRTSKADLLGICSN